MSVILLTGGRGFIGSHMLVHLASQHKTDVILCADNETYAARPPLYQHTPANVIHEKIDIRDHLAVHRLMAQYKPKDVIHLAAESHVCRSLTGPKDFITTNVMGTFHLLEEFRAIGGRRFVHISTDEVFGQIKEGTFTEDSPLQPRNPYAASKASADHIVRSYFESYAMDVVTVRMANNFGPNQHPEKLIPKTIRSILTNSPITVHGSGKNSREWLYVLDACAAINHLRFHAKAGGVYCVPGEVEKTNLEMVNLLHKLVTELLPADHFHTRLVHTDDRPTDDCRYAMRTTRPELQDLAIWRSPQDFRSKLKASVRWYIAHIMQFERALHGQVV